MSAYYQHGGCGYNRPLIRQMAKQLPAAHIIGVRQTEKDIGKGLSALTKLRSDLNSDILTPIQT